MVPVYNSVDALVSATSSECYGLPMLAADAAGKVVIAPHSTGHTDFLNNENSILYGSKLVSAPRSYQYWRPSSGAQTYMPSGDELSQAMINVYSNYNHYVNKFSNSMLQTSTSYTWDAAAKKIMDLI